MNLPLFFAVVSFIGGILLGIFVLSPGKFDEKERRKKSEQKLTQAKHDGEEIIEKARREAADLSAFTVSEIERLETQNKRLEEMLRSKEQLLLKKEERQKQSVKNLQDQKGDIEQVKGEIKNLQTQLEVSLFQKVGMRREDISKQLSDSYEAEWKEDSENRLRRLEEWARDDAIKMAKNTLQESIYRYSDISSVDQREGVIVVARDSLKGNIIGPGGKILDQLEKLSEVDVVFNDGPNTISLSCFNLVARETTRMTIEKLFHEKGVTEAKLLHIHEAAKREMEQTLLREGTDVAKRLQLKNIPPDLMKLIGRLNYRTSYGQNILRHCLEVGYFARLLAGQIGANEEVAWLGGFFHDIGKAIDQEVGGSHDVLSKEILEKYNFPWEIVHAAWTHHDAIPQETVEAVLVKAADAISAGRPGARSISLEQYIQKIKELEATASSFEGVKKAFAISAGREVRVMTDPDIVSDIGVQELAEKIAAKVEEKGGYPGKIKVTTIRITKAAQTARAKAGSKKAWSSTM